jgi:perosamine synthetase
MNHIRSKKAAPRAPFIPVAEPSIGPRELANASAAVKSGWVSSRGPFINKFEEAFAAAHGMPHGVAAGNGTVALHLALAALGVGPGDEVIVPTLTFIASVNAIRYCGAEPVFVDADPACWQMDPSAVERAVTPRTKALMVVHLYGHACDMTAIMALARRRGLKVVEDNAEGLGTLYKGRLCGTFGDVSCFSFFGNKVITTGEGGMCLTRDAGLARRMAVLRDHGMNPDRRYWHDVVGFNYRMTNVQAAIGLAQLGRMKGFLRRRAAVARWYDGDLAPLVRKGLLSLQPRRPWSTQNNWLYSILLPSRERRDGLAAFLKEAGIDSRPLFHPVHLFPPYHKGLKFPAAEDLSSRGMNLPLSPGLTRAQVRRVTAAVRRFLEA